MVNSKTITLDQLAGMMDHTFLQAYATDKEMDQLCEEAKEYHFAMVAINSFWTAHCKKILKGTGVHVGAAVSFPLGQMTIDEKVAEAVEDIRNGADEIDYVLNVGQLKMKNTNYIRKEMEEMVAICHKSGVLCKVIFENCYLTPEEIRTAAEIAREVKPDFIKTSTGFATYGARVEDVKLMKDTVGDAVKVKAAGGIRDWKTCAAMIDAGAERIGTSHSIDICKEYIEIKKG